MPHACLDNDQCLTHSISQFLIIEQDIIGIDSAYNRYMFIWLIEKKALEVCTYINVMFFMQLYTDGNYV